jgi:hypothetical protein
MRKPEQTVTASKDVTSGASTPTWAQSDADITRELMNGAEKGVVAKESPIERDYDQPEESQVQSVEEAMSAGGMESGHEEPLQMLAGGFSDDDAPVVATSAERIAQVPPAKESRDAKRRRQLLETLLDPAYWQDAEALLLRPVDRGGLAKSIDVIGEKVVFEGAKRLIRTPSITLDLANNQISTKALKSSSRQVAEAFVECGLSAGWTKMWFDGSPEFVRMCAEIAEKKTMPGS